MFAELNDLAYASLAMLNSRTEETEKAHQTAAAKLAAATTAAKAEMMSLLELATDASEAQDHGRCHKLIRAMFAPLVKVPYAIDRASHDPRPLWKTFDWFAQLYKTQQQCAEISESLDAGLRSLLRALLVLPPPAPQDNLPKLESVQQIRKGAPGVHDQQIMEMLGLQTADELRQEEESPGSIIGQLGWTHPSLISLPSLENFVPLVLLEMAQRFSVKPNAKEARSIPRLRRPGDLQRMVAEKQQKMQEALRT